MADIELEIIDETPVIELEVIEAKVKPEVVGQATPDYEPQTVTPPAGSVFSAVEVEAIPEPTATETYSENGTYNVARIGTAVVQVPHGVFPAGTLPITKNGIYTVTEYDSVNVQVQQSQEPVLLASVNVATLAENVNRIVFHPADYDLSAFRSIYFVCDGVRFSAQDWLYFTVSDSTAYTPKMILVETKIVCFARLGADWACTVKYATPNAYENTGTRLGLGDIAIYPYAASTKFTEGTVSLYGL